MGQEAAICTQGANQYYPAVAGDLVVWYDHRNGDPDIYGYDLAAGQELPICTDAGSQDNPAVSGDLVVWEDTRNGNSDIYGRDLTAGQTFPICTQGTYERYPSVSGDLVVWEENRNPSDDIYGADIALDPDRAWGANRYETAVAIRQAHPTFSKATVILATARDFPDALSAAGLAGVYHAPLLLTEPDALPEEVQTELNRLGAEKIILIGGTSAISAGVEATLVNDMLFTVERIAGSNRYETSALIAEEIADLLGGRFEGKTFIARGDSFPDALSASPIAYNRKTPILLTPPGTLAPETADALLELDIEEAVVLGGTAAVSAGVKTSLDAALVANGGSASLRWSGADRYKTSVAIAEEAKGYGLAGVGFIGLTTGLNFPDALAGGVACGQEYGVLLLTPPSGLPKATSDFLADYRNGVGALEAYGGLTVLPEVLLTKAKAIVN